MLTEGSPYSAPSTARQSGRTLVRRAIRTRDRQPVLLKSIVARQPQPKDVARLDNEYRIAGQLDTPAVVRPIALEAREGVATLVLEDFGGEPLERQLGAPMAIDVFLDLAIRITAALSDVHRRGVIHKDINPDNILVDPQSREVKLTEFGIATLVPREQSVAVRPSLVEGTLAYMAPEQTGRMNRPIDARSDLYALGVVFYRMLTGTPPFSATDPLEWIHCQIARIPVPPSCIAPAVPVPLSELVLKLLAKDPEQRYQSAEGLQRDLERCEREWRARGRIVPFRLGEHDAFDRFRMPRTLYGRDPELAALRAALRRVAATGQAELGLVRGCAGIGKSSIVRELHEYVLAEGGLYLEGKFEKLHPHPYGPILHALREAVLDVLADGETEERHRWRTDLLQALGPNAKLMVDVIPELEQVLGPSPDVPELPRGDAEKRFRRTFRAFIGVFARPERPLVLFLDDLHWVDSSCLSLIEEVIGGADVRNLLLIGAYRDSDVPTSHPLAETLRRLRANGSRVTEIPLAPLAIADVSALVAEALRIDVERAHELAGVLHEKTGGNPLFVLQMLRAVRRDDLLWFDHDHGEWRWNIARIRELPYTNNVLDLLVRKMGALPSATQEVLQIAACIGVRRPLAMLALASDKGEDEVLRDLWDAVRDGLVVLTSDSYAFVHDRMQQAAYSRIPETERAAVHLRIGRLMRDRTPPQGRDEHLFDITSQLNLGAPLITSPEERKSVAELDLLAGRKARAAAAFGSALDYFTAGAELLDESSWTESYDLAYALELDRAECEWLTGKHEAARARLEAIVERARTRVDKAAAAEILVGVHFTLGEIGKDVDVALRALRWLGIDMPPHPSWSEVLAEYEAVQTRLRELGGDEGAHDAAVERAIERVVELPPMTDPEGQLAMRLLSVLFGPALWSDPNLFALHVCRMVRLSLEKGNTGCAVHGYGWFGILMGHVFHRYEDAYRWAKAGYALMNRAYPAMRPKAEFFMEIISIWTQPLDTVIEHARAAARAGLDMGDVPVASWCRTHVLSYRLLRGDPLHDIEREATECLEVVRRRGVLDSVYVVLDILRYVRALRGTTGRAGTNEPKLPEDGRWLAERTPTMVCWHHLTDLMTRFMLGDYAGAREAGVACERLLWASLGHVQVYQFHFYHALSLAALHDQLPEAERAEVEGMVQRLHERLTDWSTHNPKTFSAVTTLVGAELARLRRQPIEAARGYERAAQQARMQGLVQVEALACELAARHYRAQGIEGIADIQLREARDCWLRWGALAKAAQIESAHPHLMNTVLAPATTVAFPVEQIDLLAVTKASQTISEEILPEKVTEALLDVVLEQSGAQKGCLILRRDGALVVALEARPATVHVKVTRPNEPAMESRRVPSSIVASAWETRSPVLLDDARQATPFATDPYVVRTGARSVLCVPILLHGEPAGLVYLENNLVAGAFTRERLMVLELLAQQAAISLRNAQLLTDESEAKLRAEHAERRSRFLARAGAILAESLDSDSLSSRLARLLAGSQADSCSVLLLENGEIRRAAVAHADPTKEAELLETLARYPLRLESPLPGAMAIRTGTVQTLEDLSDEELRRMCEDDEQARRLRSVGMRHVLAVPLVVRGKMLGSISLVRASPSGAFGPEDVDLVQDLAGRAALAFDNALLHRETQEAVRLRDEFLAVASHELNTPMTSLVLTLQMLLHRGELSPERRHDLTKMAERQAGRMTRLIGELLDVTRIDRREIALTREQVDLAQLVRDAVTRFAPELEKARCAVTVTASNGIVGDWDRLRLEQVVGNLLSNAVKFGAGKPIEIVVGTRDGKAYFEVTDHGIGIEPAAQLRIFDRFERAVSVRHYGGLGLGLYICRRIVEAHGGTIHVRGTQEVGTTFTVELPFVGGAPRARNDQDRPMCAPAEVDDGSPS